MRIARFNKDRIGVVRGASILDVTEAVAHLLRPGRGDALVRALPAIASLPTDAFDGAREYAAAEVTLDSPVRDPGKIVAAPVNYRAHVSEANADPGIRYGHTITDIGEAGLFLKATSSLAGMSAAIPLRFPDRRTDHEVELVAVIGTGGSDIPAARALRHVAGYAVGLDITLRGPEDRSFRKSIDGYSVLGPWLTTADEVANPDALALWLDVNGARRQAASTASMVYGVARLIEFASSFYRLEPGDLIYTGTPEGVGPIVPGDRIAADIDGLGRIDVMAGLHRPGT